MQYKLLLIRINNKETTRHILQYTYLTRQTHLPTHLPLQDNCKEKQQIILLNAH